MLGKQTFGYFVTCMVMLTFLSPQALAGVLTGELDKVRGTTDDTFVYTLSIEGDYQNEPQFPEVEGIEVRQGRRSSSVQIINGRMSQRLQLSFYLIPGRAGVFEIPAITMELNGEKRSTLPLTIEVEELSSEPMVAQDRAFFVERSLSATEFYVGEALIVTDRIYTRTRLFDVNYRRSNFPSEFRYLETRDERRYERQLNGTNYTVIEHQSLLVATRPGKIQMLGASLEASYASPNQPQQRRPSFFDDLMGRQHLTKSRSRSEAHDIVVKALPAEGRSLEFSGLVGQFELESSLDQRRLQLGEQLELTVRVFGDGLTDGMRDPETSFADALRVYPSRPEAKDHIDGENLRGERLFRYILLPTEAGSIELGKLSIQFFNPHSGRYEWHRESLGSVYVESTGAQESDASKRPVPEADERLEPRERPQQLAVDIRDLRPYSDLKAADPGRVAMLAASSFASLSLILGVLAWLRRGWEQTAEARQRYVKKLGANRRALERLTKLREVDKQELLGNGLTETLRLYISDRTLNPKVQTMSTRDLEGLLLKYGAGESLLIRLRGLCQDAQRLSYAAAQSPTVDPKTLVSGFESLLRELEALPLGSSELNNGDGT